MPDVCPACGRPLVASVDSSLSRCAACKAQFVPTDATEISLSSVTRAGKPRKLLELSLSPEFKALYRLGRLIGSGAVGTVFQAIHLPMGRTVAVKFLVQRHESDLARFLREAKLLGSIRHPNVVQIFDIG
ncbi:MAG: protein kinase [Candidatus Riflebacteria bacterium]|nr:protein kinase [Candidatus Riflebacteria bacterium]